MNALIPIALITNALAEGRAGFDFAPLQKRDLLTVLDAEDADIASRTDLGQAAIRPFIGWQTKKGRFDLRVDFQWDQTDSWVESDHVHHHVGLLRMRLDYLKRLNDRTVSPVLGLGLRWDQGFSDLYSDSTTAEEIDNAIALNEEIKAELNKIGIIGSFGVEWTTNDVFLFGFRWDLITLARSRDSENAGITRRLTVENDAVVTCGWKF